jgi:hypothetical protein
VLLHGSIIGRLGRNSSRRASPLSTSAVPARLMRAARPRSPILAEGGRRGHRAASAGVLTPASSRFREGYVSQSRRGDSNPGPLHYESPIPKLIWLYRVDLPSALVRIAWGHICRVRDTFRDQLGGPAPTAPRLYAPRPVAILLPPGAISTAFLRPSRCLTGNLQALRQADWETRTPDPLFEAPR